MSTLTIRKVVNLGKSLQLPRFPRRTLILPLLSLLILQLDFRIGRSLKITLPNPISYI